MNTVVLLAIVVAVVVLVMVSLKAKGTADSEIWPFEARKPLSRPEQVLYFRLIEALPGHIILAQVQLSRFLGVAKGNNRLAWLNRINRMSADFVVCNRDASVIAVIELDDATHRRSARQTADAKKDKALAAAGIGLVRWQAKAIPDVAAIRSAIMPAAAGSRVAPGPALPLRRT